MASIYVSRDGRIFDSPNSGKPTGLSRLFADARNGSPVNIYAGINGANRRFSSQTIDQTSTTLRVKSADPQLRGQIKAVYGGVTSSGIDWDRLSPITLQAAINEIPAIAALGGVEVEGERERFTVAFRNLGAVTSVTVAGSSATPDAWSRTSTVVTGTASVAEVQWIEIEPAAIQLFDADDWSSISAASMTVSTVDGDASNLELTVFEFDKPPQGGQWTISTPSGLRLVICICRGC